MGTLNLHIMSIMYGRKQSMVQFSLLTIFTSHVIMDVVRAALSVRACIQYRNKMVFFTEPIATEYTENILSLVLEASAKHINHCHMHNIIMELSLE